ncbi:MAG: ribonuclease P protein component [Minisyncoccia bacterium]
MLSKPSRLPSRDFRAGRWGTASTPYFVLKTKPNIQEKIRIGVIANASVHKNAAKRNFWKRQTKATLLAAGGAGTDFLVILTPKINTLTKQQFKELLRRALPPRATANHRP